MNIDVNYLALFLAAVASMVVGFVWYSPILFAKPWMKLMGITADSMKNAQKEMGMMYGLSFFLALITGYVLAHVMALSMNFFGYPKLTKGLMTAFWMWLGFVMPVQATAVIFGKEKGEGVWKLFAINTGYQLAALIAMGVVLAFFN